MNARVTRIVLPTLAVCFALLTFVSLAVSGDAPSSRFIADYITQVNDVQKQIIDLEQAIPQEKFTWRPAKGVRSIGEVYLHLAGGNYLLLTFAGYEPPKEANFTGDPKKWETATTDKGEIAKILRVSFDHVRATVAKISDADLEKKVDFFGNEISLRGLLINGLNHDHEHLGQSIAYARMNGVVPPWTAAAEAKSKEKGK